MEMPTAGCKTNAKNLFQVFCKAAVYMQGETYSYAAFSRDVW